MLVSVALAIVNESGTNVMIFYAHTMVDVRNGVSGKLCQPNLTTINHLSPQLLRKAATGV